MADLTVPHSRDLSTSMSIQTKRSNNFSVQATHLIHSSNPATYLTEIHLWTTTYLVTLARLHIFGRISSTLIRLRKKRKFKIPLLSTIYIVRWRKFLLGVRKRWKFRGKFCRTMEVTRRRRKPFAFLWNQVRFWGILRSLTVNHIFLVGWKPGTKITFEKEGDQSPDRIAG